MAKKTTNPRKYNVNINPTAQKVLKKTRLTLGVKLVLALLITAVLGISLLFSDYIITNVLGYEPVGGTKVISYDELNVHFVDVGQGDSTIVEFPDGKTMIVDGGDAKKEVADKLTGYIDSYLDIEYFDYAIVTHADADHCGSMDDVLALYPAKTVYRPNMIATHSSASLGAFVDPVISISSDNSVDNANLKLWTEGEAEELGTLVYRRFIEQAYKPFELKGVTTYPEVIVSDGRRGAQRGDKPSQDINGVDSQGIEYTVEFYAPTEPTYSGKNDYSNIMIIEYGGFSFLLSGDAEKDAEQKFVEAYADITFNVDVIKAGHHGSSSSSNSFFLEHVVQDASRRKDVYVAISCGKDNKYGHPTPVALKRYADAGFSSDNIKVTKDIGDYRFSVKRNESGEFALYFNGESLRGVIRVSWYAIAGGLWITSMTVIFVVIRTKKPAKSRSRK